MTRSDGAIAAADKSKDNILGKEKIHFLIREGAEAVKKMRVSLFGTPSLVQGSKSL